ncbi:MAG: PqqD family protein [Pyrinomonadaceae bacterium]
MTKKSTGQSVSKTGLPLAISENIIFQEAGEETLIYNLKTNNAYSLNSTAAMVWRACNGKLSIDDIADEMSVQTKKRVSSDLVRLALDQLNENNLLAENARENGNFGSRRELIKKAGFASMIALPLILSITAPRAASAQSVQGPCLPLNVCIGPSNICPPACNGRTIIYDLYLSNNGSCTNFQAANLPLACGPAGFFSVRDIMVTSA